MRLLFVISFVLVCYMQSSGHALGDIAKPSVRDTIPATLKGDFTDDYGISYNISDSLWLQKPKGKFHIVKWDLTQQYIIARNDDNNSSDPGLFTRIDYVMLPGMEPYQWGFCLSSYNAKTALQAENGYKADKFNPRKGCNGFPFSRMKR